MAEQALKYISKDESMVFSAIKSEMNRLDWETQLNLTRAEGETNEKIKIAKSLLSDGVDINFVAKHSKLTIEEVIKIKEDLNGR